MSNDVYVTVRGFTGGVPIVYNNENGGSTVTLRVACTPRRFDRGAKEYTDGTTQWYTIRCYNALAENVKGCITTGTPVIVRGKLTLRTWDDKNGVSHFDNTILADALGIELSTGQANYTPVRRQKLERLDGEPAGSASDDGSSDESDAIRDSAESYDPPGPTESTQPTEAAEAPGPGVYESASTGESGPELAYSGADHLGNLSRL